jgi:hypothetical protein
MRSTWLPSSALLLLYEGLLSVARNVVYGCETIGLPARGADPVNFLRIETSLFPIGTSSLFNRNGTLVSGLDTKHECVCYPQDDRALPLSPLLSFQNSCFQKNSVIEIVISCFLILK